MRFISKATNPVNFADATSTNCEALAEFGPAERAHFLQRAYRPRHDHDGDYRPHWQVYRHRPLSIPDRFASRQKAMDCS